MFGLSSPTALTSSAQTRITRAQEQRFHEQATAALAHGRFDKAEALVVTRPEGDPAATALRARMQAMRGKYANAEALLLPVANKEPSGGAGLELGLLLVRVGRAEEAVPYFEAVIAMSNRSVRALDQYRAGRASRALGLYQQANTFLHGASLASPSDPAIQTAWAELFLEKYNTKDAARLFESVLTLDDEWAPAHVGMARSFAATNPSHARAAAERALEIDRANVDAYLVIAEQELGDRNKKEALESIEDALEINPWSLEARALLASIAYLEDRVDDFEMVVAGALEINPEYGDIYRVAGSHAARAYRFTEAVMLVRRALQLDPYNIRAHAELGLHLLRTGDEPGARKALERAFDDDPFNVITFNLLSMMDTLSEFETFEQGDVIVRLHRDDAPVLKEYVIDLAQEALDTLAARYQIEVEGPILIEMFPQHDDFAVRNLGLPGMSDSLGACFGRVVTMDSPRARPQGDFNWRATLWHEISHVITLQMSNQRVPRWLTEGIAVYEEQRARPAWGLDQELAFARALNDGEVLALRDLNSGFSHPEAISLAYFEAFVLVEHLINRHGEPALHELLRAYGEGLEKEEALGRLDLDFDTLQVSFDAEVEARFGDLRRALRQLDEELPEPKSPDRVAAMRELARKYPGQFSVQFSMGLALRAGGDLDGALDTLERAVELVPMVTGIDSPHGVIAAIAQERGDRARAMQELELLLAYDHTSIDAARKLAALAEEAGDERRMELAYDRIIGIDPFDAIPHQAIGRLALAQGEIGVAAREFRAALAAGPVDVVTAHCDLAETHVLAGDLDAAKREALAALEIAPTYERAQELLLRVIEGSQ